MPRRSLTAKSALAGRLGKRQATNRIIAVSDKVGMLKILRSMRVLVSCEFILERLKVRTCGGARSSSADAAGGIGQLADIDGLGQPGHGVRWLVIADGRNSAAVIVQEEDD